MFHLASLLEDLVPNRLYVWRFLLFTHYIFKTHAQGKMNIFEAKYKNYGKTTCFFCGSQLESYAQSLMQEPRLFVARLSLSLKSYTDISITSMHARSLDSFAVVFV